MPYPNEHAARLRNPGDFAPDSFRRTSGSGEGRVEGVKIPDTIDVVWGKLKRADKPADPPIAQALRFPISTWSAAEARAWLADNEIKPQEFEPAADKKAERAAEIPASAARLMAPVSEAVTFGLADGPTATEPKRRTFRMIANTGAPMRSAAFGRVVLDLDTLEIPRQAVPALVNHDRARIAGYTREIRKGAAGVEVFGDLSARAPDGAYVAALSDEGFPWQASVYVPPEEIEDVPEGAEVKVNGAAFAGPGVIFRRARLGEVSFVPVGADDRTMASAMGTGDRIPVMRREPMEKPEQKHETPPAPPAPDLAKAERERCQAIFAEASGLGVLSAAEALITSGASFAAAQVKLRDAALAARKSEAPGSTGGGAEKDNAEAAAVARAALEAMPIEERAKVEFAADGAIREEFAGRLESYVAWRKLEDRKQVKILSKAEEKAVRK